MKLRVVAFVKHSTGWKVLDTNVEFYNESDFGGTITVQAPDGHTYMYEVTGESEDENAPAIPVKILDLVKKDAYETYKDDLAAREDGDADYMNAIRLY